MLQFIRDRAQGWLAWVIVVLIGVPFVLWGVQDYLQPDVNVAVAEVNGQEISLNQFTTAHQRVRAQLRGVELDQDEEARLRRDTLDRLLRDEVMVQAAAEQGLRISDAQLAMAIQSQEGFQEQGRFSQPAYDAFVRSQGFSAGGFEEQYRRTLLVDQVFTALTDTAFSTGTEARALTAQELQQRSFSVLRVRAGQFTDEPVEQAEVQAYFDANRDEFRTEERVSVAYLRLSRDELARQVRASEDELRALYEARKAAYTTPEQRRVRHILVQLPEDADEAEVGAARARLDGARERIAAGEDFAVLARELSDDPGSAAEGGDLGSFARGAMDPAFEDAAFALPVGELSDIVRTPFGLHLIEVQAITGGRTASFEEARDDLLADHQAAEAEKLYYEQVERLANLVFEQPDNLDVAAEALDLEIQRSESFTRAGVEGDAVLSDPAVLRAAFSEDVLAGNNSEPIEPEGGGVVVVLRVLAHEPAADQPLEAVREAVVAAVQADRAGERARSVGRELVLALRAGEVDRDAAAAGVGAEWNRFENVTRRAPEADAAARRLAFRLPRPAAGEVVYDGDAAGEGDFVVVALDGVQEAEAPPEAMTNLVSASIQRDVGQAEFRALIDALRERAEVVLHDGRL